MTEAKTDLVTRLRTVTLDLSRDQGWHDAARRVDVLMHTASPSPLAQPNDEHEVIKPAIERAQRAAKAAGVNSVVMTSSSVAIMNRTLPAGRSTYDEGDWSDLDQPTTTPYVKSKRLPRPIRTARLRPGARRIDWSECWHWSTGRSERSCRTLTKRGNCQIAGRENRLA